MSLNQKCNQWATLFNKRIICKILWRWGHIINLWPLVNRDTSLWLLGNRRTTLVLRNKKLEKSNNFSIKTAVVWKDLMASSWKAAVKNLLWITKSTILVRSLKVLRNKISSVLCKCRTAKDIMTTPQRQSKMICFFKPLKDFHCRALQKKIKIMPKIQTSRPLIFSNQIIKVSSLKKLPAIARNPNALSYIAIALLWVLVALQNAIAWTAPIKKTMKKER